MTNETVFWDTYAMIEIIKGNKEYIKYFSRVSITSNLNLMELYYNLLRLYGKDFAEKHTREWAHFSREIPEEVMRHAMQFKLHHKKEKLSYIDCMGYMFAMHANVKFLTGDKAFQGFPHVEFVR